MDVSIERGSEAQSQATAIAIAAICLYPLGEVLLFGGLLFCARDAITSGQPNSQPLSKAIRFLYSEYHPSVFWYTPIDIDVHL